MGYRKNHWIEDHPLCFDFFGIDFVRLIEKQGSPDAKALAENINAEYDQWETRYPDNFLDSLESDSAKAQKFDEYIESDPCIMHRDSLVNFVSKINSPESVALMARFSKAIREFDEIHPNRPDLD